MLVLGLVECKSTFLHDERQMLDPKALLRVDTLHGYSNSQLQCKDMTTYCPPCPWVLQASGDNNHITTVAAEGGRILSNPLERNHVAKFHQRRGHTVWQASLGPWLAGSWGPDPEIAMRGLALTGERLGATRPRVPPAISESDAAGSA